MRHVFHKWFFIWNLDKEENWINNMASHGYSLVRAGRFSFEFDETEAGKYKYKTLFLSGSANSAKNTDFYKFIEEMGIEVVCTLNYPGTCCVYTRGLATDFPDGIEYYSDKDSRIKYLRTSLFYFIFATVFLLLAGLLNLSIGLRLANTVNVINLVEGFVLLGMCVAGAIAIIRLTIQIVKLKKDRKINE